MKLKEILEEEDTDNAIEKREFFEQVLDNCDDVVSLVKKYDKVLIRGVKKHQEDQFFIRSAYSSERTPLDTSSIVDKFFEEYRDEFHPNTASRKNGGIFCFVVNAAIEEWQANAKVESYGNPFVIFPVNNSKYCQNENVSDFHGSPVSVLIGHLDHFIRNNYYVGLLAEIESFKEKEKTAVDKKFIEFFETICENFFRHHIDNDLITNIKAFSELFRNAEELFELAEKDSVYMEKCIQLINNSTYEIEYYFNTCETNLKTILVKGNPYNETIINTPKYYALKFSLLEEFLTHIS